MAASERDISWQLRQVRRAVELGLGAAGSEEMEFLTVSLDHDPAFASLMAKVESLIGSG